MRLQLIVNLIECRLAIVMAREHCKELNVSFEEFVKMFGNPVDVTAVSDDQLVINYAKKGAYLYDVAGNKMSIKKVEVDKNVDRAPRNDRNIR